MSNTALQLNVVSDGNACPTSTRLSFGHYANQPHSHNQSSYQPRSPRNTAFHRLVEDNFEELELIWDSKYQKMYGYWRPHVLDVMQKYLDCGDPQLGFARVKYSDCNTEYLLPFSCKCRGFCPSCHQRRVVEFGEYLHDEVLLDVSHRQWVFTIPKRLRPYFMHNRKLLAKLSLCAWQVLSDYLKTSVAADVADESIKPGLVAGKACCSPMQPGCVIAVQTFGELINFNPHLHIIASSGCFTDVGTFIEGIPPNANDLLAPFAKAVLKMLKKENVISLAVINNMSTWQHSGFNIHCGNPASFSDSDAAPVTADNSSAIADSTADNVVSLTDNRSALTIKRFKKNWARLIQKVYDIDPLKCPQCGGKMRIIAFIEEEAVIKKILSHLNRWLPQYHDPPDYPDYLDSPDYQDNNPSPSTSLETAFALPCEAGNCGNLQLNMFSGRSYEWWEAGNPASYRNVSAYYNSDGEYQSLYEDEFSQEVYYDE